jgi:hypothetical protein
MKIHGYFHSTLAVWAISVLATLFLIACNQSQPPTTAPAGPESKTAATPTTTKDVYAVFEGPWAIVPDPTDPKSVLLLAPKTKHHRDLYVSASNKSSLGAGTYDLSIPARTGSGTGTFDASILRAKIDPKNVQHVLDDKSSDRYAIRLPKPDAYLPATRHRSRVSATYPPDPSTEKEYATAVSLLYSVSSLNGFSLGGTQDVGGTFSPLLFQVDTPTVRFVIDPVQDDDLCYAHSRMAFHDLVKLVGLSLYVDFPDNPNSCHGKDPQNPPAAKTEINHRSLLMQAAFDRAFAGSPRQHLLTAIYFFGGSPSDCHSPIVGGN